jgi:hypothetical protein
MSGMPFQADIIPTPMRDGWALNCEDGIVFADATLRAELKARHPAVVERVEARRKFVRDELGIDPAALLDALMPAAVLARERTITGACITAVDNRNRLAAAA